MDPSRRVGRSRQAVRPEYGPQVPVIPRCTALVIGALLAGSCTSVSPEELDARFSSPDSTVTEVEATSSPTTSAPPSADGPASTTTVPASEATPSLGDGLGGLLAIGGFRNLVVTDPSGRTVESFPTAGVAVTQPTWSRDGANIIATAVAEPVTTVAVEGEAVTIRPSRRPYFFYSWSTDGAYIAALGPGPLGTSLDILGPDGVPVSDDSLDTASFYLAWEPGGGDDLVIHRDRVLELVRDPTDLTTVEPLGEPGQLFLAPAWIPGTRHVLLVEEAVTGGRLTRLDVDTLESVDLGPVDGSIGIAVSPDGRRAVLAHAVGPGGDGNVTVGFAPAAVTASTEIIDLETAERTPISDELSIWTEWSPDGTKLALMQPSAARDSAVWVIWDGESTTRLEPFRPTLTFFRNYVFFSWQYTESPRIWSPGSNAIVYAAQDELGDSIWVRRLDSDSAIRVSEGDVAFWSP